MSKKKSKKTVEIVLFKSVKIKTTLKNFKRISIIIDVAFAISLLVYKFYFKK